VGSSRTDFVVHLDRPRIFVAGTLLLGVTLGMAWWLSPVGLLVLPLPLIMLVRVIDPRPQLILSADGATFGGLMKSTWWRDVRVTWAEIEDVRLIEDQMGEPPRLTKSIPLAPERLTRAMKRLIPPGKLDVETFTRVLSVYPPGRGLALEDVEREIVRRWRPARSPD
jgi:hypothetical protein